MFRVALGGWAGIWQNMCKAEIISSALRRQITSIFGKYDKWLVRNVIPWFYYSASGKLPIWEEGG